MDVIEDVENIVVFRHDANDKGIISYGLVVGYPADTVWLAETGDIIGRYSTRKEANAAIEDDRRARQTSKLPFQ